MLKNRGWKHKKINTNQKTIALNSKENRKNAIKSNENNQKRKWKPKKCLKLAIKSQEIQLKPRKLPKKIPQKYAKNEMESRECPKIELENTKTEYKLKHCLKFPGKPKKY